MKKAHLIYLLSIVVLIIYAFKLTQFNKNLDSIYDEGFLFLKIQAASQGIIEGGSQWAMFVDTFFGSRISGNILYLRIAGYFVHLTSILLFAFISLRYLKRKCDFALEINEKIEYLLFVMLFGTLALGGIVISYNALQEFFLISMLLSFLDSTISKNKKNIFAEYYLIGFLSFFAIMTILPSGILVLCCLILLMLQYYIKDIKMIISNLIFVFIGFLTATVLFHFFIADIGDVFVAMKHTANNITKLNRGYDPLSFLLKIIFYFRDYYIHISVLIGLSVISYFVMHYTKKIVGFMFFLLSLVLVVLYLRKPLIETTTLLSFSFIVLFFLLNVKNKSFKIKEIFNFETLLLIFLFFYPLISSIGTNVSLAGKMSKFILPWSLLLFIMMNKLKIKDEYHEYTSYIKIYLIVIIAFLPFRSIYSSVSHLKTEKLVFDKQKPISNMIITSKQKEYFDKVYDIMSVYDYKKGDVIFSTQLDHMTIVAFDAIPAGLFFQPMDYNADGNKLSLPKPDYLLLTEFDLKLISENLKMQNWGFPEQFDTFFVGTPEVIKTSYSTTRILYCRRSKLTKP
ncbi:MAG: hypothetical protein PHS59_05770 [Paludibacter sp.]|nr:hypothetical protein [Paludibacter sp.]